LDTAVRFAAHYRAHTAWIRSMTAAHRTLNIARCALSRIRQLTWLKMISCEYVLQLCDFMWIYVSSCESKQFYLDVHEFTSILTWFDLIVFQIIWFSPYSYGFIWLCFDFILKYAHSWTAAHWRTAGQPHIAARTAE
jgi:hypothetical protein